jgi:phosphoribosylaminoimidazolecarboxamide formyltransferase/IMP cyclohydrolase
LAATPWVGLHRRGHDQPRARAIPRPPRDQPDPLVPDECASWLAQLDNVALASDGYIPFRDNIDQAARHGVRYIAHPGGSVRNNEIDTAAGEHHITIVNTGIRLFHH